MHKSRTGCKAKSSLLSIYKKVTSFTIATIFCGHHVETLDFPLPFFFFFFFCWFRFSENRRCGRSLGSFSDLNISLFKGGGQCFGGRAFSQNFTVYVLPIFIIIAVNIKCLIKDLLPLSMKVNVSHVCPLSFRFFLFFFF